MSDATMSNSERSAALASPQRALVVEGGAMRGIFAAGVLDAFLYHDYYHFDVAIGVSAGSTNLMGYLAGNHGRSYRILTNHALQPDFMSFKRYAGGGHLCDVDWLWSSSRQDEPLDVDTYLRREIPLLAVTTLVRTGHPQYHLVTAENVDEIFPASCAMPIVFRRYPEVNGEPMSDGGLGDSIPVIEAYRRGARDITVIRSVPSWFRDEKARFPAMLKPLLADYPRLLGAALRRERKYKEALEFIANPPADCKVTEIAPPNDFPVSRFTRDIEKLNAGYRTGVALGDDFVMTARSAGRQVEAKRRGNVARQPDSTQSSAA